MVDEVAVELGSVAELVVFVVVNEGPSWELLLLLWFVVSDEEVDCDTCCCRCCRSCLARWLRFLRFDLSSWFSSSMLTTSSRNPNNMFSMNAIVAPAVSPPTWYVCCCMCACVSGCVCGFRSFSVVGVAGVVAVANNEGDQQSDATWQFCTTQR